MFLFNMQNMQNTKPLNMTSKLRIICPYKKGYIQYTTSVGFHNNNPRTHDVLLYHYLLNFFNIVTMYMNYYLLLNIKINKTIYKMYLMYCEDSFTYFTKILQR